MSDFERVQIEPQQFAALSQKVDALAARVGPADANYSLHQVLTHIETTLFAGLEKIAKASGGGDNSQVLNAINNLSRKVDEAVMGLKEDVQTLTDKISTIETNTTQAVEATQLIADDVAALKQELVVANERSNVDLSGLIERAENIGASVGEVGARLRNVAGPNAGSDPEAAPDGEPA